MRDFLEDLEVRSSVSDKPTSRENKQRSSKKHKLRNIFRLEETKTRDRDHGDNRYASLVTYQTPQYPLR